MTEPEASIFVSYQHADKPLARDLAAGLIAEGFRVWIDEGELKIGDSLFDSIAGALDQVDFVLALMSLTSIDSQWCQKEISLAMTGEVSRKGVTVLPLRIGGVDVPATLKDKLYLDVDANNPDAAVKAIAVDIRRHLAPPAPLPPRRRGPTARSTAPPPAGTPHGPLRLVEVDKAGVTAPSGDGSRGSGLYTVPLRLSGTPDALWSRLFVHNWDNPPQFGTMHRPGIATIVGDRIILNGTTVPEVVNHHQQTLKLCVTATNDQHALQTGQSADQQAAKEDAARRHAEEVERGLAALSFDDDPIADDLRTRILREVQRVEQDAELADVLMLTSLALAVDHPRHLVKAELIRLLDDGFVRSPAAPSEDFGGGYDLIQPGLTSAGVQALETTQA